MANGYSYISPAMAGSTLFPGESFDPTMTVEGNLIGRPVAPTSSDVASPSITTAGFDFRSINWAVVLIVVGLAIIVAGRE